MSRAHGIRVVLDPNRDMLTFEPNQVEPDVVADAVAAMEAAAAVEAAAPEEGP